MGGKIIDAAGNGILAKFGSIVSAVECAVALQIRRTFLRIVQRSRKSMPRWEQDDIRCEILPEEWRTCWAACL